MVFYNLIVVPHSLLARAGYAHQQCLHGRLTRDAARHARSAILKYYMPQVSVCSRSLIRCAVVCSKEGRWWRLAWYGGAICFYWGALLDPIRALAPRLLVSTRGTFREINLRTQRSRSTHPHSASSEILCNLMIIVCCVCVCVGCVSLCVVITADKVHHVCSWWLLR